MLDAIAYIDGILQSLGQYFCVRCGTVRRVRASPCGPQLYEYATYGILDYDYVGLQFLVIPSRPPRLGKNDMSSGTFEDAGT